MALILSIRPAGDSLGPGLARTFFGTGYPTRSAVRSPDDRDVAPARPGWCPV